MQIITVLTCEEHPEYAGTDAMHFAFGRELSVQLPGCYKEHLQSGAQVLAAESFADKVIEVAQLRRQASQHPPTNEP